jgi:hypothetical protein
MAQTAGPGLYLELSMTGEVVVENLVPGGAADRMGGRIQQGDAILEVGFTRIASISWHKI